MSAPRFSQNERALLLAVKGVGPGVVKRLEEIGVASLDDLARRDAGEICAQVAAHLGTTCWKNSPKARAAVGAAIAAARAAKTGG
ncbi:MAG: Pathogenicity locus [Methylocystis sp.]|nr:MAG: Pathogenicity locus [Methylocystis sp.]